MSIEEQLAAYMKKLSGPVSLNTLFPSSFIRGCSAYSTIKDFLSDSQIIDQQTFDKWKSPDRDFYVRSHSRYQSWDAMYSDAAKQFVKVKQAKIRNGTWKDETFHSADPFLNIRIDINFTAR